MKSWRFVLIGLVVGVFLGFAACYVMSSRYSVISTAQNLFVVRYDHFTGRSWKMAPMRDIEWTPIGEPLPLQTFTFEQAEADLTNNSVLRFVREDNPKFAAVYKTPRDLTLAIASKYPELLQDREFANAYMNYSGMREQAVHSMIMAATNRPSSSEWKPPPGDELVGTRLHESAPR